MHIAFFTAGGTIDKIYFDAKSAYQVGETIIHELMRLANVTFSYSVHEILQKDSLDMTDADRKLIADTVAASDAEYIVVTHGTDTMVETGRVLQQVVTGKTVVFTGAMQPARFRDSDAIFNLGCAIAAVQSLPHGVYLAMNGQIFNPATTRKNVEMNRFETIHPS